MPWSSSPARLIVAIFLLSSAALVFQVAQTRLLSATLGYHLTFLAVSIALLGVGAGATASRFFDRRERRPSTARLATLASASFLFALAVSSWIDPVAIDSSIAVSAIYATSSVPYLLVSWVLLRVLAGDPARAGRTYAADLAGAAVGGVIAFLAMSILGAQGEYGLAAALSALAALVLTDPKRRRRIAATAVVPTLLFTVALAGAGDRLAPIRTSAFKPIIDDLRKGGTLESGSWDPQGRVDVVRQGSSGASDVYDFLVDRGFQGPRPPALVMRIDFDAATLIVQGGTHADTSVLQSSVLAAPYRIVDHPSVLVIGPGGGIDVLVALDEGARSVTGVDVNRAVISTVRDAYRDYGGGLYDDPRVSIVGDEARSFVRRSNEQYDVVVMTVVDSWAALQSGAYALSESYLYTEQAFADYIDHLAPGGTLSIGRWYRDTPTEMIRAMEVASAGLRRVGIDRPGRHLAVIRSAAFGLLLVRKNEFDDTSMGVVRRFAGQHGFEVAYDPMLSSGPLAQAFASGAAQSPSTDDHPFFFDSVPLVDALTGRAPLALGQQTLVAAFITALALTIGLILLPLRRGLTRADPRLTRWVTTYAVLLGGGFIVVEIVLLQRLTLYLGQPTLALTVGVAGLLFGAAIGSAGIRRIPGGLRGASLGSTVALAAVLVLLPIAADATLAAPLVARIACAVTFAGALGLPLGTVFPRVLRAAGADDPGLLAWAWGVNGAVSVIGSILAAGVVLESGFTSLAWVAIACYVGATLLGDAPRAEEPEPATSATDHPALRAAPASIRGSASTRGS